MKGHFALSHRSTWRRSRLTAVRVRGLACFSVNIFLVMIILRALYFPMDRRTPPEPQRVRHGVRFLFDTGGQQPRASKRQPQRLDQ